MMALVKALQEDLKAVKIWFYHTSRYSARGHHFNIFIHSNFRNL